MVKLHRIHTYRLPFTRFKKPEEEGHDLPDNVIRHSSPQIWEHINSRASTTGMWNPGPKARRGRSASPKRSSVSPPEPRNAYSRYVLRCRTAMRSSCRHLRYAMSWYRQRSTVAAATYVPLSFALGEAYQFVSSHEIVVIAGKSRFNLWQKRHLRHPCAAITAISTR